MSQLRVVLLDVHDVLYDVSQWRHWFAQSLRQIGVDTSFCNVWEFDPFPCSSTWLSDEYLRQLNRFLAEIGLNEGQKKEFCTSAHYQFRNWLQHASVFADATDTLDRLRRQRIPVGFVSAWMESKPLPEFLSGLGLNFQPDSCVVHDNLRPSVVKALGSCCESKKFQYAEKFFVSRNPRWLELGNSLGLTCLGLDIPTPTDACWQSINCLSAIQNLHLVCPPVKKNQAA